MAETTTIVLADDLAVNQSFLPSQRDGLLVRYEVDGASQATSPSITMAMRKPVVGQNRKLTVKLEVPDASTLEAAGVIEFITISMDIIVPPHISDTIKADAMAFLKGIPFEAQFIDAVDGFFPY